MKNNAPIYDELDATKQAFVDWLCTPKNQRKISTQVKLAEELSVSQQSLSKWKGQEKIKQAVRIRKRQLANVEDVNDVIDSMKARACKVDDNPKEANEATQLFFKWLYGEKMNESLTFNINQNQAQANEKQKQEIDLSEQLADDPEAREAFRTIRRKQQSYSDNE